jgi:hypothetical protein
VREQNSSALFADFETEYPGCRASPRPGGRKVPSVTSVPLAMRRGTWSFRSRFVRRELDTNARATGVESRAAFSTTTITASIG